LGTWYWWRGPIFKMSRNRTLHKQKVILNVYDLADMNGYGYNFGLGAFHSGVEVCGSEYTFGGHPHTFSGVFTVEPRHAHNAKFRESILIGESDYSSQEIKTIIENLSKDYPGNSYHLITKNCNHFSGDLCKKLCGNDIPGYVNRLAYWASWVHTCLPMEALGLKSPTYQNNSSTDNTTNSNSFTPFAGSGMKLSETNTSTVIVTNDSEDSRAKRDKLAAAISKRLTTTN